MLIHGKFHIYTGGGQKSVHLQWVLYHRSVLYLRVIALQMAYCTYLFEDSVTKIWKFDFFGPHPINIEVLILVFVNMLETPL